jgi:hypothetical protein
VFLARWTFSREESLDIMNDMVQVYTLAQLWQLKDVQTQFREAAPFAVQQLTRMLEVLNRSIEMAGRGQGIPLKYEAYAGNPGLTRFADIDQILGDMPGSQPGTPQDGPGPQGGVPSGGVPVRGVPEVGGVDFTAMPMVVQALERVRALPAVSPDPALSSEDVSLEQEQLSGLIRAGIQVSAQRAAEHVQQVMGMPSMRPAALQLLRSILRQDERLSRPSDQRLKDLFVIFESSALP